MKAVRLHQYGDADQLVYEDAPDPTPDAGEVVVDVKAAGINPMDWKFRSGLYQAYFQVPMPLTLVSFAPIVPLLVILVVEGVGLSEFGRDYGMRVRVRDYLRLIVGFLPYHLLLAGAACHAASRELRGVNNWEKTAHVGAHL